MRATEHASQRTKNRLREHDLLPVRTSTKSPVGHGVLCKCSDCPWTGWLPIREIIHEGDAHD